MSEVNSAVPLGDMEFVRMWMRLLIQPNVLLEIHTIDNQRIPLPVPDRMPIPTRVRFLRVWPAIQVNLVEPWTIIVGNHYQKGFALHELIYRANPSGLSLRHRYQAGIRLRTSEYFH